MRQNIGLILLTLGSLLLSINVFKYNLRKFFNFTGNSWDKVPWEVRLFCKLFLGIKNSNDYDRKLFLIDNNKLPSPDDELKFVQRISIDMPMIALILMIIGMLLCLNYSVICKLF